MSITLQDYCDILGIELNITYYPNQQGRWCASFGSKCEFKENEHSKVLSSTHGNATTPDMAIATLLDKIRGKWLVINATNPEKRREYQVPHNLVP